MAPATGQLKRMEPPDEFSKTPGGTTVEELERFRQDIERYRARRKAVSEEFEGFVQGFKKPVDSAPPPPPATRATAPPRRDPQPVRPPAPLSPTIFAEQRAVTPPAAPTTPQSHVPARRSSSRASRALPLLVLVGLVIAAAVWFWPVGREPATAPDPQPSATQRATPAAPPTAAPATPPPAPAPAPSASELTTTRAVWIRVVADGARVVSRELPAGARVPFTAERTIEIRAGDAGAVRLTIGGRDQGPLGRDGEVVTRSFTVPPR